MIILKALFLASALICGTALPNPRATCPPPEERIDCHPTGGPTRENCEAQGCCWEEHRKGQPEQPLCFFPTAYGAYTLGNVSTTENGLLGFMTLSFPSLYPRDVPTLRVDVENINANIVRVKISDPDNERYETPYPKISSLPKDDQQSYTVELGNGFRVSRREGGSVFDSIDIGGLIYADQFLEISTTISGKIFGVGEHRTNLTIEPGWKRITLFNHDNPPSENNNLYGSHPFYLVVEDDGRSHGVYLHNSNAMEVLISPKPYLSFRTIGGILDFYFFLGPTPADVIRQYTSIVGRSFIPPYWSLGFHLCRFGYNSAENTRAVWKRNRDLQIPYDVQWNDIDYMVDHNIFTLDPNNYGGLPDFVQELHDAGMHYIPIVDPGLSASEQPGTYPPWDLGVQDDVLVKDRDGNVFVGRVWNPVSTAWPDFTSPKAQNYWNALMTDFHDLLPFDGIWIDMNEPSNFLDGTADGCPDDDLENPPYVPGVMGDKLAFRTLCMTAQQAAGSHYNVHNLYSISEAEVTNNALRSLGMRPFVLSRSTFSGSGKYTGHWSGDNGANWYDMRKSVQEVLQNNLYGIPMIGADICGFGGDTNPELCNRWYQLGAFYPFMRNHNDQGKVDQDPAAFDEATVNSIRKVLNIRYTLLPYLYTLFYLSAIEGDTVARPLFFEFATDSKAYEVETAFLWGSGLYIIPVLDENAREVNAYFPQAIWYDWYTGSPKIGTGNYETLDAPYDTIPLFIRGGTIIPVQKPEVTTTLSRRNDVTLIIALDENGAAEGSFFWDDGDIVDPIEKNAYGHITYSASNRNLTGEVHQWNSGDIPFFTSLIFLGEDRIQSVIVNGVNAEITINENNVVTANNFTVPAFVPIVVEWN